MWISERNNDTIVVIVVWCRCFDGKFKLLWYINSRALCAQKGVLGAYLLITLTFSYQHDQLVGVYSDRLKNRGLWHGSGQKRGVLRTGQARKKGGLRHGSGQKGGLYCGTYLYWAYLWVPPSPPPPPGICIHVRMDCSSACFRILIVAVGHTYGHRHYGINILQIPDIFTHFSNFTFIRTIHRLNNDI